MRRCQAGSLLRIRCKELPGSTLPLYFFDARLASLGIPAKDGHFGAGFRKALSQCSSQNAGCANHNRHVIREIKKFHSTMKSRDQTEPINYSACPRKRRPFFPAGESSRSCREEFSSGTPARQPHPFRV